MEQGDPRHAGGDDPRVHFAAERTLLAWVRTGLALMGLGFVVARFGLFLRELAAVHEAPAANTGFSLAIGTTLVALGVVVQLGAAARHGLTVRRLNRGEPLRFGMLSFGAVVALLLALLGVLIALYLLYGLPGTS